MSNKRKNFHYHYAEQYDRKNRGNRKVEFFFGMPKKTIIFAVFMLIIFGIISTTFATYSNENIEPQINSYEGEVPHISFSVKTAKKNKDLADIGAYHELAATGWYTASSTVSIYFDTKEVYTTWGLNSSNNLYCKVYYGNGQSSNAIKQMTRCTNFGTGNSNNHLYYCDGYKGYGNISGIQFFAGSSSSTYSWGTDTIRFDGWGSGNPLQTADKLCFTATSTSNWTSSYDLNTPSPQSVTISKHSDTSAISGTGTSSNPYIVAPGTKIKVQANVTTPNNENTGYQVKFLGDSSWDDYSTDGTTTNTLVESAVAGTTYSASVQARGHFDNSNSYSSLTSSTIYFKGAYKTTVKAGDGGTLDKPTSSPVYSVSAFDIQATPKAGCTFVNWTRSGGAGSFGSASSSSTTFTPTATGSTLTANFSLNAPTISISYTSSNYVRVNNNQTYTASDTATITSGAGNNATYTADCTIKYNGDNSTVYTATDKSLSDISYKPLKPGNYTVTLTPKASAYRLNSTGTAVTFGLYVYPNTPRITDTTVFGFDSGTGTATDHYKVPLDSTSFQININLAPNGNDNISGWDNTYYQYMVSTDGGSSWTPGSSWNRVGSSGYVDELTYKPPTNVSVGSVMFKFRIVSGSGGRSSSEVNSIRIYYDIIDQFLTFESFSLNQKIYDEDDDIDYSLEIYAGGNSFNTTFNSSNSNLPNSFNLLTSFNNRPTQKTGTTRYFDDVFNLKQYLLNGVHFLKATVTDNATGGISKTVDSPLKVIKGTNDYSSSKCIYFTPSIDLSTYKVFICYSDTNISPSSGNATWVTMSRVGNQSVNRYKACVPDNAVCVAFYVMYPGYFDKSNNTNSEAVFAYSQFEEFDIANNNYIATVDDADVQGNHISGEFGKLT